MQNHASNQSIARRGLWVSFIFALAAMTTTTAVRAELPAALHKKVEAYKSKLSEWAANPEVIKAVNRANTKGAGDMTNAAWNQMNDKDPAVAGFLNSMAGEMCREWETKDRNIGKVYLRDKNGNLVAGSNKPFLFNNGNRPPFKNAVGGNVWAENDVKTDPTTLVKSVQVSAPIKDHGKVIGVIQTSVIAD